MTVKRLVLVAVLAAGLAACGTGGEAVRTAGDPSTTSSTVGLPKEAGEKAMVQDGVLRLSDLPPGFVAKSKRATKDDSLDATIEKIPECAQLKALTDGKGTGEAKSPHFKFGEEVEVSNDVEIFATTAELDAVMAVIPAPGTVTCLQKALQTAIDASLAKDPATAAKINGVDVKGAPLSFDAFGDGANGVGFTITINAARTVHLYFDLIGVKVGRTLTTYSFQDSDAHLLGPLSAQIIRTTVNRLRGAGGVPAV